MDRVTQGFYAGISGCLVKSLLNAASNRLGIMRLRNSAVGCDLVLGKRWIKRQGTQQWLLGELSNTVLGGLWGTVMGIMPPPHGNRAWITRGIQYGSLSWLIDLSLGANAARQSIQGPAQPQDALVWWTQHVAFGLTASYLLHANPHAYTQVREVLRDAPAKKVNQIIARHKLAAARNAASAAFNGEDLL